MENMVFPQMNTLVRMRERTLLSGTQKNELRRASDVDTILKSLMAVEFFSYAQPRSTHDIDSAISDELKGWMDWARQITPDRRITDMFELPDIIHNIRVFIKAKVLERDLSGLYLQDTIYDEKYFSGLLQPGRRELSDGDKRIKAVIEDAVSDFSIHKSLSRIDLIVKFFYHSELVRVSEEIGEPQITDFVTAYIDLDILSVLAQQRVSKHTLNESILFRSKGGLLHAVIPKLFYDSEAAQDAFLRSTPYSTMWDYLSHQSTWDLFDVFADNYLLGLCKKAKLEAFGLFPLFAFMYAKLLDIKNVRTLVAAKRAGADAGGTAERLRDGYDL
ncbi:MAG: V-type ATPase subunit [Clostridiaceae bacterium]|nr:V-type ATPase subunit [Clostridiaceae bacterium]